MIGGQSLPILSDVMVKSLNHNVAQSGQKHHFGGWEKLVDKMSAWMEND